MFFSELEQIIYFTGNNGEYVKIMIDNFLKELKRIKKGQTKLCEPIEEFAIKLEYTMDIGGISDAETLSSKIAETLNTKHKLLQDSIECVKYCPNAVDDYHVSDAATEFDRLQICSPILFHGCFKKIYLKDSPTPILFPKSPSELEESIKKEDDEESDKEKKKKNKI
uniref:Uncharacterized protein n=1 Tax=Panagrolaimus sp. PS1159 TaxID=55785 RepID=A0AC35FI78_9BILA